MRGRLRWYLLFFLAVCVVAGLFWYGGARAQDSCTVRVVPDGTTCHAQGTVGTSGADMIIDNTSINATQVVTITSFTISAGNA